MALSERLTGLLLRSVPVRHDEIRALLWSFGYFFFLLSGYYVLRPLRDTLGIAGGIRKLPYLFTATFLVLVLVQPAYSAMVARLSRRRFIPLVYHFFVANIVIFWLLLTFHISTVYVARAFFVWVSVFNLFVVSVFWSFMADLYSSDQSKRLYGFIGAGGTAGSLLGPTFAISLSVPLGAVNLLLIAIVLLELAVLCTHAVERATVNLRGVSDGTGAVREKEESAPLGGGALDGLKRLVYSPYLIGIAVWVSLLSFCATFLYLQQANIVLAASHNRATQTRIFASIDLIVGLLTLATQTFATGPLMLRFGIGAAAALLPLVFAGGFIVLAAVPELAILIAFQALQRTAHFAISTPARQAFFTVVEREDKYKVKNVIDLVVYRGSDALWGWLFISLRELGFSLSATAAVAVPLAVAWFAVAIALGHSQERRAELLYAEGD